MGFYGFENIDSARSLSLSDLKRMGYLKVGYQFLNQTITWRMRGEVTGRVTADIVMESSEAGYIQLRYSSYNRPKDVRHEMNYRVELSSLPCRYGGRKWFYICPNQRCGRRCRVLYGHQEFFVCRKCTGLWYDSQTYTTNCYRQLDQLFKAERLEQVINRRYYRGKPTRKYRRFLKLTGGRDGAELLRYHCRLEQKSLGQ